MSQCHELRAVEREERTGKRMEAEGVAFLQDEAGGLAPDFDDIGFGHLSLLPARGPALLSENSGRKNRFRRTGNTHCVYRGNGGRRESPGSSPCRHGTIVACGQ